MSYNLWIDPLFYKGIVEHGFGRGSKQLGIPTANFPSSVVDKLPPDFTCGIYFGCARVANGDIHKMVMSVGWNPHFKNEKKSMETHILHVFDEDFYGAELQVCIVGFIRPEKTFASIDALISEIKNDISTADRLLGDETFMKYSQELHEHFRNDKDQ